MFDFIRSLFGWKTPVEPRLVPPPASLIGIRIPADGTPPHRISLTTTSISIGKFESYPYHVPNVRQYWNSEEAWKCLDLQRLELQEQIRSTWNGVYYVCFSFAIDDLPENTHVPEWLANILHFRCFGDVFVVKMAPEEYGEHAWAIYEDVPSDFLEFVVHGPAINRRYMGFRG